MKKIIEFFIDKSLVVNLFTVIVFVVGGISAYTLQKDVFPQVDFDVIVVTTAYPGTSSEDVEKLVTLSVERSLKEVDGIKELTALSSEGVSIAYLKIEAEAELEQVERDVRDAIDSIDDFPEDVKEPKVRSINNKNRRGILKVALYNDDYTVIRDFAKNLRDHVEEDRDVSIVDIQGYREDEIVALIDPAKLEANDITLSEVTQAVARANTNLSAGKIESNVGDVFVRTLNEFEGSADVSRVVIRSNSTGQKVSVGDVAKVVQRPVDNSSFGRYNGEEAVLLDIKIKGRADIIATTDRVKERVNKYFEINKVENIKYSFVDDSSYFVKRRLNVLKDNSILGIVLVLVCLIFFLNFKTAFITSLGAPISFMIAFIAMSWMGISLNLISMFGLILVLGMLVDDSIIVAEQFYQKLEDGHTPKESARLAAIETIKPVTTTILTTMIAFGALFFMGGIMGKFLWPVPATVIICLAASWFECFFILPSHLADFVRLGKKHKESNWFDKIKNFYSFTLKPFVKFPTFTVLGFFILFVVSGVVAKNMNFELFPGDDVRVVYLQFKGPVGIKRDTTSQEMLKVELALLDEFKRTELIEIQTKVGQLRGANSTKSGSHYGSIIMYLTDPAEREVTTDEIINRATAKAKKLMDARYVITIKKQQGGPPRGLPVDILLKSDSLNDLKLASKEIRDELAKLEGIVAPEIDFEEGNDQIIFKVNEVEAKRLGLDIRTVALELRRALAGDEITVIRRSDEDVEVKVKINEDLITNEEPLLNLTLLNSNRGRIKLSKIVALEKRPGAYVIRRLDRKRVFSISSSIDKKLTNPRKVTKDFTPTVKKVTSKFKGMSFDFGGENQDTKESMSGLLKSFIIAASCIFLILVLMFNSLIQPIVVMSAIPLGMIGVIWAFKVFGMSLGFMAMMGVIGLVGVVINDSIVLVNFINMKRREIPNLTEAVLFACKGRLRPVLLTTITTVAGLLPIAHGTGGDPFLKPMAMSFAWGLAFATAITLVFVPCFYIVFEKLKNIFRKQEFKITIL